VTAIKVLYTYVQSKHAKMVFVEIF